MGTDHLRPQLEGHRPHAEGGLQQHQREQRQRQLQRLTVAPAAADGLHGEDGDQQAQATGKIAVDHLVPALLCLHRGLGKMPLGMGQLRFALRHAKEAVAARPVGAAEAGVGQPRIGAEQNHQQRQRGGTQGEPVARSCGWRHGSSSPGPAQLISGWRSKRSPAFPAPVLNLAGAGQPARISPRQPIWEIFSR
ncbi:hypothetical protein D3C81_1471530 [compost metagenome]